MLVRGQRLKAVDKQNRMSVVWAREEFVDCFAPFKKVNCFVLHVKIHYCEAELFWSPYQFNCSVIYRRLNRMVFLFLHDGFC